MAADAAESQQAVAALPLFLDIATQQPVDSDVALAAAHCLLKAAHLHPGDAAAVLLATPDAALQLACLLDPAGGAAVAAGQLPLPHEQQLQREALHTDVAPLLLVVLASLVERRPQLLAAAGVLRPALQACLAAVGDPGLARRWSALLAA